ncbi:MAG TPA: pyridoxamine 5'-phosphate oxidase [Polyangiales bacterium]|jgi:pyridoxamine 5'-phosphate oxidase
MSSDARDGALEDDPLLWFRSSFERARQGESFDAARAALATTSAHGRPSVRFVLVKQVDALGFVFYTNYDSRKARDLTDNPQAALAFHWASLGEQWRIEGVVTRVSTLESDSYFATRPRGSQLGAWASAQSAPIVSRALLEAKLQDVTERFRTSVTVARPANWGGFRIVPGSIEVWSDRADRLHDRHVFTRDGEAWTRRRLQP